MAKWIPKQGDKLYLHKNNTSLMLLKNEFYGTILSIEEDGYLVENLVGKITKFRFCNQDDVFFKWFKNTPLEEKFKPKYEKKSKKEIVIVEEEDLEEPILNEKESDNNEQEDEE